MEPGIMIKILTSVIEEGIHSDLLTIGYTWLVIDIYSDDVEILPDSTMPCGVCVCVHLKTMSCRSALWGRQCLNFPALKIRVDCRHSSGLSRRSMPVIRHCHTFNSR